MGEGFVSPKNLGVELRMPDPELVLRGRFAAGGEGKGRERRGTEREKRDRKEEKGREKSWNRAADWLRPALERGACRSPYI